jgi:hypothetical protein
VLIPGRSNLGVNAQERKYATQPKLRVGSMYVEHLVPYRATHAQSCGNCVTTSASFPSQLGGSWKTFFLPLWCKSKPDHLDWMAVARTEPYLVPWLRRRDRQKLLRGFMWTAWNWRVVIGEKRGAKQHRMQGA